ncbi:MAG: SPOR domain-containing protein [Rhodobacteraceae bacterium]|nr:SPOR domain-containing protein [Paracoccaceae bacterium]
MAGIGATVRVSARTALRNLALAAAGAGLLAACEPGAGPLAGPPDAEAAATPQKSTRIVDRDVEAPDAFQVTDQALWDGRPSLGGVWVASPDATDPERVIMRNPANGKFVIGALFKRERDNPGPTLQISSDAAEALGLLAGQPGRISVTALRREEAPETAPEKPLLDTNETLAAAAPGAIDAGGVETRPLETPAAAGKPGGTAEKERKSATETAKVAAGGLEAAAPKATVPAGEKPAAASGGRPIQIGFFSIEANAQRARDKLAKAGITAEIRKESAKGKDYWTVFARGDTATLKKIKAAGFADAYLLK